jgi:hypothetical protein
MLFVKLIRIASLLKDLDLTKHFNKDGCDVTGLVNSLPKDVVFKLCDAVGIEHDSTNEVDATIGLITDFFYPLVDQAKASKNLPKLIQLFQNYKK